MSDSANSVRIHSRLIPPDPAEAAMTPDQLADHKQQQQAERSEAVAKQIDEDADKRRPGQRTGRL